MTPAREYYIVVLIFTQTDRQGRLAKERFLSKDRRQR